MSSPAPNYGIVFVNYRRTDSGWAANTLVPALQNAFGEQRVFQDVRSIDAGDEFKEEIEGNLQRAAVLLVLVGEQWLFAHDDVGRRRLDREQDWVRREIRFGLEKTSCTVIPVLVDGAKLPTNADSLPTDICDLLGIQRERIRQDEADSDIVRLVTRIEALGVPRVAVPEPATSPGSTAAAATIEPEIDADLETAETARTAALENYLKLMLQTLSFVEIPGLDKALPLEVLWTRPRFLDPEEGESRLHRILAKRAVAIEAPAGFGKTTLSRIVAISIAKDFLGQECADEESWQKLHLGIKAGDRAQFPIHVELPNLSEFSEIKTLLAEATPRIGSVALTHVEALLENGRAAVILDGLDEVALDSRDRVIELVNKARLHWSKAYFILTSRSFSAKTLAELDLAMAQIQPIDTETACDLIGKWSDVLAREASTGFSEAMRKVLDRAGKGRQLVTSPLVVALLGTTYKKYGTIPDNRARLFAKIGVWLLGSRSKILESKGLDLATTTKTLEGIAFSAVRATGPAGASKDDLAAAAANRTGLAVGTVDRVIRIESEGANCLIESRNRLTFWHESLRDYFAACWLVRQFRESGMKISSELMEVLRDPDLRVVGDFFVALLGAEDSPAGALEALLKETTPEDTRSLQAIHAAALQTRILGILRSEGYRLDGLAEKEISRRASACLELSEEAMREMSIADRVEARVAVGRLGKDVQLYGPPLRRALPIPPRSDIRIGRYPVTVQEYRKYITEKPAPEPGDWSRQLDTPNAPVTGLSWTDAAAYCSWLTEEIRRDSSRRGHLVARLPTMEEWRAMTGSPVSGRWPGGIAAMQRSFDRRPVGVLFEHHGVEGHQDLSDGVWEWIGPSVNTKRRRKQVASCTFEGNINRPFWRRVPGNLQSPLIGFRVLFEPV